MSGTSHKVSVGSSLGTMLLFALVQCGLASAPQGGSTAAGPAKSSGKTKGNKNPPRSIPSAPRSAKDGRVHLKGVLVEGGAECPRFRASDNTYFTLEGDLHGLRIGDAVEITGVIPQVSHCMQDTPVRIETIREAKPPTAHTSPKAKETGPRH